MQLGLLAAAGHATVPARPRPRVTVISTGDELVEPGRPLIPGQIWESNSVMLAAAARQAGCATRRYPVVRDDTDAVLAAVQDALADADLLITSGGVSMGAEHDVVKAALSTLGTVTFRKVAMQPGMPQGFGTVGRRDADLHAARQPGQRVRVVLPVRRRPRSTRCRTLIQETDGPPHGRPHGAGPLTGETRGRSCAASSTGEAGVIATPVSGQASHQLASLARANALVIVPEEVTDAGGGRDGRRAGAAVSAGGASAAWQGAGRAGSGRLTHLDAAGQARMVDVSGKDVTARTRDRDRPGAAVRPPPWPPCATGTLPKGDALAVARIAGIQGAKRTPDLIPLCHPIGLHAVAVDLEVGDDGRATSPPSPDRRPDRRGDGGADRRDASPRSR